ncbi:hypothetical protein ACLB2K_014750 [Fragaria x ananassa]
MLSWRLCGMELVFYSLGVSEAIVESDCLVAVNSIKSLDQDLSPLSAIILDVKSSLTTANNFQLQFADRQDNMVAHRLAGLGLHSNIHCNWFSIAPDSFWMP